MNFPHPQCPLIFPCDTKLVQDDIDRGYFVSGAMVTAADPDNQEISKTAEVSTTFVRSPSISLGEISMAIPLAKDGITPSQGACKLQVSEGGYLQNRRRS